MATILRTPALLLFPPPETARILPCFSFQQKLSRPLNLKVSSSFDYRPLHLPRLRPLAAAYGETAKTEEAEEAAAKEDSDDGIPIEDDTIDGGIVDTEENITSTLMVSLQSYKEALMNNDQPRIAEIEAFLQSIEDEKKSLEAKVATLSKELSIERDRVLRISADFDNFRKRTERERLSLMTNVQGEVIESLLPVLDNFERAKVQLKVETEGEEKINSSYQSIYKQFLEILSSLGVEAVETVGNGFDPLLHEAIMREESTEFEEGIIIQEFRRGFKLGERLLRPSMVKVSAGPGPQKSENEGKAMDENGGETSQGSTDEGGD